MKKTNLILLCLLFITITISACTVKEEKKNNSTESNTENKMEFSFEHFDGSKTKKISLKKGDLLKVDHFIEVEKGDIVFSILDEDGILFEVNFEGSEEIEIFEDGEHTMKILAKDAKGKYKITWEIIKK